MTPSPELVKQVAAEFQEIQNAPPIMHGVSIPTCHFCGRILKHEERTLVETHKIEQANGAPIERFRGRCCGG